VTSWRADVARDLRRHGPEGAVAVYAAVALVVTEYVLLAPRVRLLFPTLAREVAPGWLFGTFEAAAAAGVTTRGPWWGVLLPQAWWVGGVLLLWVVVPLVACAKAGIRPVELGASLGAMRGKWAPYAVLLCLMLPAVWWASAQPGFLQAYPMLKPHQAAVWGWPVLAIFWGLYALQFVAVEFFFRGFLLFLLERRLGVGAVALSVVPYAMIHFHKPMAEALGAIVAGAVLGWLALRTRSIWGGVALHVGVALSMDAAALWRSGAMP